MSGTLWSTSNRGNSGKVPFPTTLLQFCSQQPVLWWETLKSFFLADVPLLKSPPQLYGTDFAATALQHDVKLGAGKNGEAE